MIGEGKVNIGGFKFEKVDGRRNIQSVFIQDVKEGSCAEVPIVDDINIDKEKLAEELLDYYRKEVVVCIDIKNDPDRPNSNYVDLGFVGINKNNLSDLKKIEMLL